MAAAPTFDGNTRNFLERLNISMHSIPMKRAGRNPFQDVQTSISLARLMRKTRPDLVLTYTIKPNIWGMLAARFAKVPNRVAMITGLGYAFGDGDHWRRQVTRALVQLLYRKALRGVSLVIFQNMDDEMLFRRNALISPSIPSLVVGGSGVNLQHFPYTPVRPTPPIRFLMITRLLADKGVREYQKAAALLRREHPGIEFHLAGPLDPNPTAISAEELEQWILSGDIIYHGSLQDVRPLLVECSVFVLPSYYREGTPRTVLEAMAIGRAIVTTDAPGCKDTVEEGFNGLKVPLRDVEALVAAMRRLVCCPRLIEEMGRNSRKKAEMDYDVHQINRKIINEIIRGGMSVHSPQQERGKIDGR